jgi:Ice-binding-like
LLRHATFARIPAFALAAASAACAGGSSELESVTAASHTMSMTQALADGSITEIDGTYGSGCAERSGSWSIRVSGTGMTDPPLTVVRNNAACVLTLTSLVADQTYTTVSPIALTDTYAGAASAFEAGDAGGVRFYANAKLDPAGFAGDFVVTVVVSGDPNASMSTVTAGVLGAASSFAVLAGSAVACSATPPSAIAGDVGVSPGVDLTSVTPGQPSPGTRYAGVGTRAEQAQTDLVAAMSAFNSMPCPTANDLTTKSDLGGKTLAPGVYCFGSTAALTGALILDAGDDPDATWVFQIGTAITTAADSTVQVINGGSGCKVYWLIGSAATLGANDAFLGNMMAGQAITLGVGTTVLPGRVLAHAGGVTLDGNTISATACQ